VEVLAFLFDSFAILIALYLGLRDDRRPLGAPQRSLFRTFDSVTLRPGKKNTIRGARDRNARSRIQ